jgi:carbamoyltransferase
MIYWGINAINHDAGISVVKDGVLVLQKLSENSPELNQKLVDECLLFGKPNTIFWQENPWLKKTRQLFSGQFSEALDLAEFPKVYLSQFCLNDIPIKYSRHHFSHAANGYYNSKFRDCLIFVVDAVGEWDTISVWKVKNLKFEKIYSKKYPFSLGLFYTAFTKYLNYKNEKEMMKNSSDKIDHLYDSYEKMLKYNLHKGIKKELVISSNSASNVQKIFEDQLEKLIQKIITDEKCEDVVFCGGCAYNKKSIRIFEKYFKNVFVPKYPGDFGNSLGCILAFKGANLKI